MDRAKIIRFIKFCTDMTLDELSESEKLIHHLLGIRRSQLVLVGELERPGKRGKRWSKPNKKK